jgi:hypothetical protein
VTDEALGHDGAVLGLVVAQVGGDGAVPVDVGQLRPAAPRRPVEGAVDALDGGGGEAGLEVVGHRPDHRPGRLPGVLGDGPAQPDQGGHQPEVGLHGVEHLGFEQEVAQAEAIHGVGLHDLHHR